MLFLFISGDKFDIKDYHHVFLSAGPMGLDTLEEAVDEYIENTLNKWTHERDTGSVRESRLASWSRDYHLIPLLIINTPGNHISPWFSIQLSFNSIQLSLSGHLWIPAINIHLHDCKLNPQIAADARDINRYLSTIIHPCYVLLPNVFFVFLRFLRMKSLYDKRYPHYLLLSSIYPKITRPYN